MTDRQILSAILTARQYEMWLFKKNYKENCGKFPTQTEIGLFMGITRTAVNKLQKRINNKLSNC